jgi:hypothetical protein
MTVGDAAQEDAIGVLNLDVEPSAEAIAAVASAASVRSGW